MSPEKNPSAPYFSDDEADVERRVPVVDAVLRRIGRRALAEAAPQRLRLEVAGPVAGRSAGLDLGVQVRQAGAQRQRLGEHAQRRQVPNVRLVVAAKMWF